MGLLQWSINLFDKKTYGRAIKNEIMPNKDLHKQ